MSKSQWVEGNFEDFLGLNKAEGLLIRICIDLAFGLRHARTAAGLTQQELAAQVGTSQARISRIESGRGSTEQLIKLLLHLDVSREDIALMVAGSFRQKCKEQNAAAASPPTSATSPRAPRKSHNKAAGPQPAHPGERAIS
jgi:DNA-binding XRE family transcriptional regulator